MHTIVSDRYRFVLFDLDGTLINSLPLWLTLFMEVLTKRNIHTTSEKIIEIAYYHNDRISELGVTDPSNFWTELKELSDQRLQSAPIFENVHAFLSTLRQRPCKIGIYTGSARSAVHRALRTHKLFDLLDVIITTDDVQKRKPDPEGVIRACSAVDTSPLDTLYIGDSIVDYQTATNSGVDFALFHPVDNKPYILSADQAVLDAAHIKRFVRYTDS